jgi:hypothetical protein
MDPSGDVAPTLDRESELLASAVRLVASGASPRTTVAGLRLSEPAMALVRPLADQLGVTLEPLFGPDEGTTDVVVSRRDPRGSDR